MARKKAKSKRRPSPQKKPKTSFQSPSKNNLSWMFSKCDKDGKWAWMQLTKFPNKFLQVIQRLQEFESMNWNQIEDQGSHLISIEQISTKARKRLGKIGRDNIEELMSFRITSRERVWCERDSSLNKMKILWWDPEHTVFPTKKRNT